MTVPNTFYDKGNQHVPASELDENFDYLDTRIDNISGGGLPGYRSPFDFGAVGGGLTDDTVAIRNALNSGFVIDGGGITYLVSGNIDCRGRTVRAKNMRLVATGASQLLVGGADGGVSLNLTNSSINEGDIDIPYGSTSGGTVTSGDWFYPYGHVDGTWTINSGRVCGAGLMVRSATVTSGNVRLQSSIPFMLDTRTITDGLLPPQASTTYTLSMRKVLPQWVDLDIETAGVTVLAEYVSGGKIKTFQDDTQQFDATAWNPNFNTIVRYAYGMVIDVHSRAKPNSGASHSILCENLFACIIHFQGEAVNLPNGFSGAGDTVAKAVRTNGLWNCDLYAKIQSPGMYAVTSHILIGCRIQVSCADPGMYNTVNGITTGNRNDAISLTYMRYCKADVISTDSDSTAIETFGGWYSDVSIVAEKGRGYARAAPEGGLVSAKGICRNMTYRVKCYMTADKQAAVREEFGDIDYAGRYQQYNSLLECDCYAATVPTYATRGSRLCTGVGTTLAGRPLQITQTGGLATATRSDGHGLAVGVIYRMRQTAIAQAGYNGDFTITPINSTQYTFAVDPATPSPATAQFPGDPDNPPIAHILFDTHTQIIGGKWSGPQPIIFNEFSGNYSTVKGSVIELDLTATDPTSGTLLATHGVIAEADDCKVLDCYFPNTSGTAHRMFASGGKRNGWSNLLGPIGGRVIGVYANFSTLNLNDMTNCPVGTQVKDLITQASLYQLDDGWATDGAYAIDGTTGLNTLTIDGTANSGCLSPFTMSDGQIIFEYATRLKPYVSKGSFRYDVSTGKSPRAEGPRRRLTVPGIVANVAAGAKQNYGPVSVTGLVVSDSVESSRLTTKYYAGSVSEFNITASNTIYFAIYNAGGGTWSDTFDASILLEGL